MRGSHCCNRVYRIALDEEWVSFRMLETIYLKVYFQSRPFNGIATAHTHIKYVIDAGIAHPGNAVV